MVKFFTVAFRQINSYVYSTKWLSLKRGFDGREHGFRGCGGLDGLGGFGGFNGLGRFGRFNGLGGFGGFDRLSGFGGFDGFLF